MLLCCCCCQSPHPLQWVGKATAALAQQCLTAVVVTHSICTAAVPPSTAACAARSPPPLFESCCGQPLHLYCLLYSFHLLLCAAVPLLLPPPYHPITAVSIDLFQLAASSCSLCDKAGCFASKSEQEAAARPTRQQQQGRKTAAIPPAATTIRRPHTGHMTPPNTHTQTLTHTPLPHP